MPMKNVVGDGHKPKVGFSLAKLVQPVILFSALAAAAIASSSAPVPQELSNTTLAASEESFSGASYFEPATPTSYAIYSALNLPEKPVAWRQKLGTVMLGAQDGCPPPDKAKEKVATLEAIIGAYAQSASKEAAKQVTLSNLTASQRELSVALEAEVGDGKGTKVYGHGIKVGTDYVFTVAHALAKIGPMTQKGNEYTVSYRPYSNIKVYDAAGKSYPVEKAQLNPFWDAAMVPIETEEGSKPTGVRLRSSNSLQERESVFLLTTDLYLQIPEIFESVPTIRDGDVISINHTGITNNRLDPFSTTIKLRHGHSGAQLMDAALMVVGVANSYILPPGKEDKPSNYTGSYYTKTEYFISLVTSERLRLRECLEQKN